MLSSLLQWKLETYYSVMQKSLRKEKRAILLTVDVHIKDDFNTRVCEGVFLMVHIDSRGRAIPYTN